MRKRWGTTRPGLNRAGALSSGGAAAVQRRGRTGHALRPFPGVSPGVAGKTGPPLRARPRRASARGDEDRRLYAAGCLHLLLGDMARRSSSSSSSSLVFALALDRAERERGGRARERLSSRWEPLYSVAAPPASSLP
jgi:hypothetical protein